MARKILLWTVALIVLLAGGTYAAVTLSPWPAVLYMRHVMDDDGARVMERIAAHVPPGITEQLNLRYDADDPDALLDVFHPAAAEIPPGGLPTVVWVHGGGFIGGTKDGVANYLRILASRGFVTIGVDYTLAPEATYPTPVRQANAALGWIAANAGRLDIDPDRIFLAGDSAGAQIAGQLANIIADPGYAATIGIAPSIDRDRLRGLVLVSGFLDPARVSIDGAFGGFVRTVGWSYFGEKNFMEDRRAAEASVTGNLGRSLPPVFIAAGNQDPLEPQSRAFADKAVSLGVAVDAVFFPGDRQPPLQHEFQFDLDTEAGRTVLDRMAAFLKERAG